MNGYHLDFGVSIAIWPPIARKTKLGDQNFKYDKQLAIVERTYYEITSSVAR